MKIAKPRTILQWLDRGGRYVLHVEQYLTRTLSMRVHHTHRLTVGQLLTCHCVP